MTYDHFEPELFDALALGVLDASDADQVRDHMRSGCAQCHDALRLSLATVSQLALTVPAVRPPARLRKRITALVQTEAREPNRWLRPAFWALAGLVLVAVATLAGLQLTHRAPNNSGPVVIAKWSPPPVPQVTLPVQQKSSAEPPPPVANPAAAPSSNLASLQSQLAQLRNENARIQTEIGQKNTQLAAAEQSLAALRATSQPTLAQRQPPAPDNGQPAAFQARIDSLSKQVELYRTALEEQRRALRGNTQLVALLNSPHLHVVDLNSTENGGGSSARAIVSDSEAVFVARQLPALPPGRTYQLWIMRRTSPAIVSAGIFQPDAVRAATLTVANTTLLAGLTAMAVTEEPAGGSLLPTGQKILVGLRG